MAKPKSSLRERFDKAMTGSDMFAKQDEQIKSGHYGGAKQFYERFEAISASLKTDLETFVEDVRQGNVALDRSRLYLYQKEPLRFEIAFPASFDTDEAYKVFRNLMGIPGYRKIHEICSSSDVDMDVRTAGRGSAFMGDDGEPVRFNSVVIEIDPTRPYEGPLKASVKAPRSSGNQP